LGNGKEADIREGESRMRYHRLVLPGESPRTNAAQRTGVRRLEDLRVNVLLEVDPKSDFERFVKDHVERCVAEGRTVFVFTSEGSPVHRLVDGMGGVSLILFSMDPEGAQRGGGTADRVSVLGVDRAVFLTVLDSLVATKGKVNVVLDSISSLVLAEGFQDTYKLLRQSIEIVGRSAASRISALAILVKGAHQEAEQSMFRSIFPVLLSYDPSGLKVVKPQSLRLMYTSDAIRMEPGATPPIPSGKKPRRSAREMRLDVLRSIANGTRNVTGIMRNCNVTWGALVQELSLLQEKGLITMEESGRQKLYLATPLGMDVAEAYDLIGRTVD
jgi:predicted transcriptional regulator